MDLWLWSFYFLPVLGAVKILPEVELEGEVGGSVIIECPLPEAHRRMYLCRLTAENGMCATVVSNTFVKREYQSRVALRACFEQSLFLVEMTDLAESDGGVYACGVGMNTDLGKTRKVTLNVHHEYEPFWDEDPMSRPPGWFQEFLQHQMPNWLQMVAHAGSSQVIPKVTTPALRTTAPPAHHPSPSTPTTQRPRVSRASLVAAAEPSTLLPSKVSKTSIWERLFRPQGGSFNHRIRLQTHREFNHGSQSGSEDRGFHILIPTVLGLLLLAFLGLVMKRAIQRRRAFSKRARRQALRTRAREASQRPPASRRPRSQNNVYSACPRRARGADAAGQGEAPLHDPEALETPAPLQAPETSWLPSPSLKTNCEYVDWGHQPAAKMEPTDPDDYINIPNLAHLPHCPPGPRPWCQ